MVSNLLLAAPRPEKSIETKAVVKSVVVHQDIVADLVSSQIQVNTADIVKIYSEKDFVEKNYQCILPSPVIQKAKDRLEKPPLYDSTIYFTYKQKNSLYEKLYLRQHRKAFVKRE